MTIRTVLVGYGLAGRTFHAPFLAACPELDLASIVTSDAQRAQAARQEHPGAVVAPDLASALSEQPELVVIASANPAHVPQTLEALAAGAHVVLDKPVAANEADARAVLDAATAAGRMVVPFQNRRWDADFLTLRAVLDDGSIGVPHRFTSRFERMKYELTGSWRESVDADGGVLLDFGAHLVDQALELLGPVHSVNAYVRSVRSPSIANDDAVITLEHDGGAISILIGSQASALSDPRFSLLGTDGAVVITDPEHQEAALRAGIRPGDAAWHALHDREHALLATRDQPDAQVPFARGEWDGFYPAVAAAIMSGGAPPVRMQDAIANLRVLDAAARSAASGERVQVIASHDE